MAEWLRGAAWASAIACTLSLGIMAGWRMTDDDKMTRDNRNWLIPSNVMTVNEGKGIQFCFTYSRDGEVLACANSRNSFNTVSIWALHPARELKTIELGRDIIAAHPDGEFIVDKSYQVSSLAFSPDGKILAAAVDSKIRFWNVKDWKESPGFDCEPGAIIAFSPDGTFLAVGSSRSLMLWDLARQQRRHGIINSFDNVRALGFSPNSSLLAAACNRGPIKVWRLSTGKQICSLNAQVAGPNALTFGADNKILATASSNYVDLWDVTTKKDVANYRSDSFAITSIALSPDGKLLAATGNYEFKSPGPVILWDLAQGRSLGVWQTREYEPAAVAFSPNGKELAVGVSYPRGYVEIWKVAEMLQQKSQ